MESLSTKLAVFIARIIVIGSFTFFFVTFFYCLFYLLLFRNTDIWSEISLKCYSIAYLNVFLLIYIYTMNSHKKNENQKEKGF
jgi:hypothetical protein